MGLICLLRKVVFLQGKYLFQQGFLDKFWRNIVVRFWGKFWQDFLGNLFRTFLVKYLLNLCKKIDGQKQMKTKGDASGYCAWCLLATVSFDHLALFHGQKKKTPCHATKEPSAIDLQTWHVSTSCHALQCLVDWCHLQRPSRLHGL